PAPTGAPVSGHVTAAWDARNQTLDLGSSTLALPNSRVEFSGAIGSQLRVHMETRDLNDLLPALGGDAASLPVKLNNGSAVFDGTVTGNTSAPRAAGHLRATNVVYSGEAADSI